MGIVRCFSDSPKTTYTIDERIVDYPTKDSAHYDGLTPDWEALGRKFTPRHIRDPHWKELVLVLTNHDPDKPDYYARNSGLHLQGAAIDSYTLQALRSGFFGGTAPFLNTSVTSCLLTSDKRLVVGQRAGKSSPGSYALIGGSIPFQQHYEHNPISHAFFAEARAELGSFPYCMHQVIGVTTSSRGLPGLKFVVYATVAKPLPKISALHREAMAWYAGRSRLHGEQAAREALAQQPGFPPDAWEHAALYGLFNTPEDITSFIHNEHTLESAGDSMDVYLQTVLKGKACRHPSFVSHAPSHASIPGYPVRYPQI